RERHANSLNANHTTRSCPTDRKLRRIPSSIRLPQPAKPHEVCACMSSKGGAAMCAACLWSKHEAGHALEGLPNSFRPTCWTDDVSLCDAHVSVCDGSARRPVEATSTQYVRVHVKHGLSAIRVGVDHDAISVVRESFLFCNVTREHQQFAEQRGVGYVVE